MKVEKFETRGRKPTYGKPTELRAKIDEYFVECEKKREFADVAGMRIFLKLRKQDVEALCDPEINGDKAYEYQDVFEYARDRRESMLLRRMVTDPKMAAGCKAALAQMDNGGYTDKPHENMNRKITVKISEQDAELFK